MFKKTGKSYQRPRSAKLRIFETPCEPGRNDPFCKITSSTNSMHCSKCHAGKPTDGQVGQVTHTGMWSPSFRLANPSVGQVSASLPSHAQSHTEKQSQCKEGHSHYRHMKWFPGYPAMWNKKASAYLHIPINERLPTSCMHWETSRLMMKRCILQKYGHRYGVA